MRSKQHLGGRRPSSRGLLPVFAVAVSASLLTSCGANSSLPISPPPAGNTQVVVLLSSTSGDELWSFYIDITSIVLHDGAGKSATVYTNATDGEFNRVPAEFFHVNGASEPLLTVSLPQGTYTSATVMAGDCYFSTAGVKPDGGPWTAISSQGTCSQGTGNTTVNLPTPVTISGSTTALLLNLEALHSYTPGDPTAFPPTATITPVFTLTSAEILAQPTNNQNGLLTGIIGQITSISNTGFAIQTLDGAMWTLAAGTGTNYQGISGLSSLGVGMFVNLDATVQPDGTLSATRVEVDEPAATDFVTGPTLAGAYSESGKFVLMGSQGFPESGGWGMQATADTAFKTSGQFSNLQNLPFQANFSTQSLFTGQNIAVFYSTPNSYGYQVVDVITLMPQTINATVSQVSNGNGFTIYTVQLAPNDLISTLQAQAGSFPVITNPAEVVVYADAKTQLLAPGPVVAGDAARFRGLLFDDNGTLRMDCSQILAGATQ